MAHFYTDPSLSFSRTSQPDLLETYIRLMQIAQMQQDQKLRGEEAKIALGGMRRREADELAMREAAAASVEPNLRAIVPLPIERGGGSPNQPFTLPAGGRTAAIDKLKEIAPHLVPGAEQEFAKQEAEQQKAQAEWEAASTKKKISMLELEGKRMEMRGQLAGGVTDQASYEQAIHSAAQMQLIDPQTAQKLLSQPYDPATVKQFQLQALTAKEQLDAKRQELLDQAKTEQIGGKVMQFNPKTGRYDIEAGEAAGKSESDKYIADWLATKNLPNTPENRQTAREAYIKETKIDPAMVRVEGFAETRGPIVTDKKTGITAPMSWAEYNKLSKQEPGRYISPQYDPETQTNIIAWRDLAKGKTRDQLTSYDAFLRHAGDLYDAIAPLSNTDSPLLNRPLNWLRTNTGDPRVKSFLAKLDPVLKEFESFLMNNRALYSEDRADAKRIINENSTPAQMLAVLPSIAHTGEARMQALNESFKRATGEDIPSLYSAPAQAVLKKLGVQTGLSVQQFQYTATDAQGNKIGWDGSKWVRIPK